MDAVIAPRLPAWMGEHAKRYLASGGKDGHLYETTDPGHPTLIVPSLLLTATGRKSGRRYVFPLFYGRTGESYFVIAGGSAGPLDHPGWYKNLLAHPEAEIMVGTDKLKVRARTATAAERGALWQQAVVFWPPYDDYQKKAADREIPVVVLDPA